MKKLNISGFTIVEMTLVIVVIGILAGLATFVSVGRSSERSKFNAAISDLTQIGQAMKIYLTNNNDYPLESNSGAMPGANTEDFGKYLSNNGNWPTGPWPDSQYDYDRSSDGDIMVHLRFCVNGGSCQRPTGTWADNVNNDGTMYYCVKETNGSGCQSTVVNDPDTAVTNEPTGICIGGNKSGCAVPTFQ